MDGGKPGSEYDFSTVLPERFRRLTNRHGETPFSLNRSGLSSLETMPHCVVAGSGGEYSGCLLRADHHVHRSEASEQLVSIGVGRDCAQCFHDICVFVHDQMFSSCFPTYLSWLFSWCLPFPSRWFIIQHFEASLGGLMYHYSFLFKSGDFLLEYYFWCQTARNVGSVIGFLTTTSRCPSSSSQTKGTTSDDFRCRFHDVYLSSQDDL